MLKLPLCESHMTSGSSYVGRCWNMPWSVAHSFLRGGKQVISSRWWNAAFPSLFEILVAHGRVEPLESPVSEGRKLVF